MRLTKYEHACFTLEKDGKLLVVDPGSYTTDLEAPENVAAIVVTHEHADHFDPAALGALIAHNPEAIIYGHEHITRQFGDTLPHQAVATGDRVTAGPFQLEFFGGEHALIHTDYPVIPNLGVLVDDTVAYPGDSFALPGKSIEVLALPVAAPWLNISQTLEYLAAVTPRVAFPTHDAILSPAGKELVDRLVGAKAAQLQVTYRRPAEPIEL